MHATTRGWFAAALLLLVAAALLHAAALLGAMAAWAPLVHVTLFGWVTAMIVAVNYHTLPVFSGRDFPDSRPAWAQLATLLAGVALVMAGQLGGAPALVVAGLALELLAALIFALNVVLLLTRGRRRPIPPAPSPVVGQREVDRVGTRATSAAGVCLPAALAMLLGVRAGLLGGGWWLVAEHLAALGWLMLMAVGVALHVLPRFSGLPTRGAAWARAQLGLHLAALALIVLGLGLDLGALFAAGGLAMAVALALFAWTIWPTLRAVAPRAGLITPTVKEARR